ncbi:MAG: hypothetical protein AAB726_02245 [Patescibacteria group bacterium]
MHKNYLKNLIAVVALFVIIFVLFSTLPIQAHGFNLPFGGKVILPPFWCSCTGAWLLTIGPPKGGEFLFFPPFSQKAYFQLPSLGPGFGSWTLGLYTPVVGRCSFYTGEDCSTRAVTQGVIFQPIVGSSYASF